ncbi:MAG: hypothetical protein FD162_3506 [Rhodobacteraceae bacterium]|nr:MAG: hypothetical protein FD162_3506 [Paracoccaceae bacterium]
MKRPSLDIGEVDHLPSRVASHLVREIRIGRLKSGERLCRKLWGSLRVPNFST